MKHLRIALSLLLVVLFTAGMFTGCKNAPDTTDTTASQPDNTENQILRDPVGSFIVNAGAILELVYNADGLIVDAVSKNAAATTILDNEPQIFGVSSTDAVLELLPHFAALENLEKNGYAVLLKTVPGSKEPSEDFLTDIAAKLQEAAEGQKLNLHIFAINGKDLNTNGELTAAQAQAFLLKVLSITEDINYSLTATNQTVQGNYAFQVSIRNVTSDYLVNALTGDIMEGAVDSSFFDGFEDTLDDESELPEETQDADVEIELPTGTEA